MNIKIEDAKRKWRGMKATRGFHDAVLFLCFVAVSSLFWLILSLNDNVTETFDVKVKIENVPDTVTFINDIPAIINVTVKDRGSNLLRSGMLNNPHVNFNFRDFSEGGIFFVKKQELSSALKSAFGNTAQITASSADSLYSHYTTGKGKRVPIVVISDITCAPGSISQIPEPENKSVLIYSDVEITDTITRVYTQKIVKRNLSKTEVVDVKLSPVANVKIVPSSVKVTIPVEPLVKKESMVTIRVEGGTKGEDLLLFPAKVKVEYYTPMSLYSSDLVPIELSVDFNDIHRTKGGKLPIKAKILSDYVESARVMLDSVEYTVVRQ